MLSVQGDADASTKPDLQAIFDETMANMTTKIDKKIKFSALAPLPENLVIVDGPFVFHCPPTPADEPCIEKTSVGQCPEGIYIKDYNVYFGNDTEPLVKPNSMQLILLFTQNQLLDCKREKLRIL